MTPEEFWKNTRSEGDCLIWTRSITPEGYGKCQYKGQWQHAHRVSLLICGFSIPKGKIVLHSCDNPPCVNPVHLSIGNYSDNMRDCVEKKRHAATRKTHCSKGHPFNDENTYFRNNGKWRRCKTCQRAHGYAFRSRVLAKGEGK